MRNNGNDRHKDILTTGEVARICNVAPRTVSKWFDNGQLRGYRIPGSKDRRIPLQQLVRFMKIHGIPMDKIETGRLRILVVDTDAELADLLQRVLADQHGYEVQTCRSMFEAGSMAERFRPAALLIDADVPGFEARIVARHLAAHEALRDTRLIVTGASLTEADRQALLQQGVPATLAKPFNLQQIVRIIEQTLDNN